MTLMGKLIQKILNAIRIRQNTTIYLFIITPKGVKDARTNRQTQTYEKRNTGTV